METRIGTLDARGRELQEGDEIIIAVQGPIFFRVARITPVLDPKLPPDMLQLEIAARIPFLAKRGQVNPEFIRIRTLAEVGASPGSRTVEARNEALVPDPEAAAIAERESER